MLIRLIVLIVLSLLSRFGIVIGSSVVCVVPIAVAGMVLVAVVAVEEGGLGFMWVLEDAIASSVASIGMEAPKYFDC